MSNYYPMFFNMEKKKCTVVGGGNVGERKVKLLLESKCKVTVISPFLTDYLSEISEEKKIEHIKKEYDKSDLKGSFIVIAATDSPKVNRLIYRDCEELNIPVNITDAPELCDFIVPATLKRGPLTITVSTDGNSPALSRQIRMKLEELFGEEYGKLALLMGNIREKVKKEIKEEKNRKKFWHNLLKSNILELLRYDREEEIKALLEKHIKNYSE